MRKIKQKMFITNKFLFLKEMYKSKTADIELFDEASRELLEVLGELTMKGLKEVEGVDIDMWKSRIWNLIENMDLLPEYKEDTEEPLDIEDNFYLIDEEEDFDFEKEDIIITNDDFDFSEGWGYDDGF